MCLIRGSNSLRVKVRVSAKIGVRVKVTVMVMVTVMFTGRDGGGSCPMNQSQKTRGQVMAQAILFLTYHGCARFSMPASTASDLKT